MAGRLELTNSLHSTYTPQFIGGCNDGGLGGVIPLLRNGKFKGVMR